MSSNPASHFIILPNRPIVQANGETTQGSLKLHYCEWKGNLPRKCFCHATSQDRRLKNGKHLFPMEELQLVTDLVKEFMEEHKK